MIAEIITNWPQAAAAMVASVCGAAILVAFIKYNS